MPDRHLVPLFLLGSILIVGFVIAIIASLVIQKQREAKARLTRQRLEFEYSQSLLNTRIEVQETTLNAVAQELHDNVVQSLTGCFMQMSALTNLNDAGSRADLIAEAKANINEVIAGVRLLSHNLSTGLIERRELHDAIQAELSRLEAFSHLNCTLRSETIYELNPEQRLIAFRIVQEALHNVVRHARAKAVSVLMDSTDTHYLIRIKDDGQGFDVRQQQLNSLGLVNMSERAVMLRGELTIKSEKEAGTEVGLLIPIESN